MSYSGWANYETWAVMLWIDNSEGDQEYWREEAVNAWGEDDGDDPADPAERSQEARIALAGRLKDSFEEAAPDHGATLWGDLMTAAIGAVDWYEIADALLSGADLAGYKEAA